MSEFGDSSSVSHLTEPLPARSKFEAEESAFEIVERVIDRAIHRVERAQKFQQNLRRFSNMKTLSNISEVNALNFYESSARLAPLPSSAEPRPLYVDSLLPISADIDRFNPYKLALSKLPSSQPTEVSRLRRGSPSKVEAKEKYLKLDFEVHAEEEDGFTKELRKMQEEREGKERTEQRAKDQQAREEQQRLKEKKKEKEEKFSFDYSGLPIKIRADSKANLISKLVNGATNPKTHLDKEAFNDPNPQLVDSVVLSKKKNSQAALKRRDEVEFQDNRSLSEGVTVGAGVRYSYEGKTLELKKKAVSTIELKRTINNRRLTREEYERVRSLNGSSLELGVSEVELRQTKNRRSQSEAKLKNSGHSTQREKITVNNQNLKEKMLEKVNEMLETRREPSEDSQPRYEYVGQIDIFNMNYLKSGREPKTDKTLENLSTERSLILPKIAKPAPTKQFLPKERERIKEINTIIYEIRKKFDEKLKF